MADAMKRIRQALTAIAARLSPVAIPMLYAVMLLLILIFFSGQGEFIYEG